MEKKGWDNNPRPANGLTCFGYFDDDTQFLKDAPSIAKRVALKLGFPILQVELLDSQIYSCFEEAIITYSSEVNRYNIKENLLNLVGSSTDNNLTHREITTNLNKIINISKEYGTESGTGGNVDYKKGNITTEPNKQIYDIDALWKDVEECPNLHIEIKKVYHTTPPAVSRYFDPMAGTGVGTNFIMSEFGWERMSPAVNFVMMPMYEDALRIQAIKYNDMMRRSYYSFEVKNNKLTLFPIPDRIFKVWFDYIIIEDRANPLKSPDGLVSDFSNAPYDVMQYIKINSPGKQWIFDYTFALCKEMLGSIRGKYSQIPDNDGGITLDGDSLRNEGIQMKENLLTQLREMLDQSSRQNRMQAKKEEAENMQFILNSVPLKIYIG